MAIFGITEVPTEGVEFDIADYVVEGSAESLDGGATAGPSAPYTPFASGTEAPTAAASADPELGGQAPSEPPRVPSNVSDTSSIPPPPSHEALPSKQPHASQLPVKLNELD